MASYDLAGFTAATQRIVAEELEEARALLRKTVMQAFQNVLDYSPSAEDFPGAGRYRASNRIALGAPEEDSGEPPGQDSYPDPPLDYPLSVANAMNLGQEAWLWNNVGFGESKKSVSYA